jgi:putative SOS response-associated peptidase YedK
MCGRFVLYSSPNVLKQAFGLDDVPNLFPRYNITPSQTIAAVHANRRFAFFAWGLSPGWMKDSKIRPVNAKAETAATKPMFRSAFGKRRCLIPADGWFEWLKVDFKTKRPYYYGAKDGKPLAFAGLWESFEEDGECVETCAILTTAANELVAEVHHRMPCILAPGDYDRWVARGGQELLKSYPSELLFARPVSGYVNTVRNQGPRCIESV